MIQTRICIFEDDGCRNFGPLTSIRPVWELRTGGLTQRERFKLLFNGAKLSFHTRDNLLDLARKSCDETIFDRHSIDAGRWLFINARAQLHPEIIRLLTTTDSSKKFRSNNETIAFCIDETQLESLVDQETGLIIPTRLTDIETVDVDVNTLVYPWNIVDGLEQTLRDDFSLTAASTDADKSPLPDDITVREPGNVISRPEVWFGPGVTIDASENHIYLENGVRIGSGVILDCSNGPVYLDYKVNIEPGAIIEGPAYIGSNSRINPGARLSGGIALGPHCRVGGEVSNCVIQGFTNKQHSGYLGSSFLGSWINLGAATDNSDLKNNYRPITVYIDGKKVDSGSLHVGVIIGDFTRTAIQTRLNSGSVIGVCCNIFGSDFPPSEVPAFTWVSSDGFEEYKLDKAIETIKTMMPRRGIELSDAFEARLKRLFEESATLRRAFLDSNDS